MPTYTEWRNFYYKCKENKINVEKCIPKLVLDEIHKQEKVMESFVASTNENRDITLTEEEKKKYEKRLQQIRNNLAAEAGKAIREINEEAEFIIASENIQATPEFMKMNKREKETKPKKPTSEEIKRMMAAEKETQKKQKFNQDLARAYRQESIDRSVKLNFRIPNKRNHADVLDKKIVIGVSTFLAAAGIIGAVRFAAYKNSDAYEINRLRQNENYIYKTIVYEPQSPNVVNDPYHHWHEYGGIIEMTHNRYEDPVIGLYYLYHNMDESCRNRESEMNKLFEFFNDEYGTTYKSIEDFLEQNGFKEIKEWKEYVNASLKEGMSR